MPILYIFFFSIFNLIINMAIIINIILKVLLSFKPAYGNSSFIFFIFTIAFPSFVFFFSKPSGTFSSSIVYSYTFPFLSVSSKSSNVHSVSPELKFFSLNLFPSLYSVSTIFGLSPSAFIHVFLAVISFLGIIYVFIISNSLSFSLSNIIF